ncbi:LppU/SCO3897 family protein [Streptomyces litmocidini]|uniref:LppU/SCO3897 family protein n=1 Tax=Streptomyces litmocidini TaxID=67318 RepID=UPI003570FBF6
MCGAQPATAATVRAHQGMVVIMRTLTRRGVFCRTCGLAVYRTMTSDTLVTGWWGVFSLFVTPFVVLGNVLGARSAFRRLPEPYGALRPPLDPGRRVLRRPPAMLVLTPFVLVAAAIPTLFLIGLIAGPDGDGERVGLSVGDCVDQTAEWPEQALLKVDCGSPRAEYRVADRDSCGPEDQLLHAEYVSGSSGKPGYCVRRL